MTAPELPGMWDESDPEGGWADSEDQIATPADPLVEALARTILRHQLGCDQPAEPPAWMVAAATEIADGINCPGFHARTNPVQMRRVVTAALIAAQLEANR